MNLGSGEYEVGIVFSANPTETVTYLPWSEIKWQRTHNETSQAEFTIPGFDGGIECCGAFGGLRVWDHMLVVERNGFRVWDGPVTSWKRHSDASVTVYARDRSVLTVKTLVGTAHADANTLNLQQALALVIGTCDLDQAPWSLTIDASFETNFTPPTTAEIDFRTERLDTLSTALQQMTESTPLYWSCVGDTMQMCEYKLRSALTMQGVSGTHYAGYDNRWAVLNEHTVVDTPEITVDGADMATALQLGGATTGGSGHAFIADVDLRSAVWYIANGPPPPYITSVLQSGSSSLSQTDTDSVEAAAEQLAVEAVTPNLAIEQVQLSPDFGGEALTPSLGNLVPGTRLQLGFEDTCAFNVPVSRNVWIPGVLGSFPPGDNSLAWSGYVEHVRLEQLDVTVSATDKGTDEKVLASLVAVVEVIGIGRTRVDYDGVTRTAVY